MPEALSASPSFANAIVVPTDPLADTQVQNKNTTIALVGELPKIRVVRQRFDYLLHRLTTTRNFDLDDESDRILFQLLMDLPRQAAARLVEREPIHVSAHQQPLLQQFLTDRSRQKIPVQLGQQSFAVQSSVVQTKASNGHQQQNDEWEWLCSLEEITEMLHASVLLGKLAHFSERMFAGIAFMTIEEMDELESVIRRLHDNISQAHMERMLRKIASQREFRNGQKAA